MASTRSAFVSSLVACVLVMSEAGFYQRQDGAGSLRRQVGADAPLVAPRWARAEERAATLNVAEALHDAVGGESRAATQARVETLKEMLRPLYLAMPKNSHGRLGHPTARYALHRHFVRQYGAYMRGLEPLGHAWNASSPLGSLQSRVPEQVRAKFQKQVEVRGFDLQELALLAASLEGFIHNDFKRMLVDAYRAAKLSQHEELTKVQYSTVLNTFLWMFLGGVKMSDSESVERAVERIPEYYPDWKSLRAHLQAIADESNSTRATFDDVSRVVVIFADALGKIQEPLCNEMADLLISKDTVGRGRVLLSDFYGGMGFTERPETLREVGVLDPESDTLLQDPRLIIPNYITSATNCVMADKHFAMCCPDSCEAMLSHIEQRVAGPVARPEQLLEIVAALPSRVQSGPRNLTEVLAPRLQEIAGQHGGTVPLHGRLFAQWLHHAYPYECVFPMEVRTTAAVDWHAARKAGMFFSQEETVEMMDHRVKDLEGGDLQETLPWLTQEHVFLAAEPPSTTEELATVGRCIAFCATIFAVMHSLLTILGAGVGAKRAGRKLDACLV
eukprot:TRINITY_DN2558_c0_g1_i1.p1 TRINITY_DN2558_c0_g1~~TRINITY_DN2558_c0_g1_i1.p1  ORF type:complete len:584 (-),score=131.71 TRINITY_DN2558_c0_g1_i1:203-1882(-)